MIDEKDSVRLQRVVDAMDDNYEPRKLEGPQPEIFDAVPRRSTLSEYKQQMEFLSYLAEHPNLIKNLIKKNA